MAPTTCILLAHPEPQSFTAAWAGASAAAARAEGHDVMVWDLHAAGFDPVERPGHYANPTRPFDVLKEQERASEAGALPGDVAAMLDRLEAAEALILHFPLWWFAPPAILKGWCERVLAHGRSHDVDRRFDTGRFRGRRVLFCVSTGSRASESGPDGREGNLMLLLWPLAMTFRYLGFDVCEPLAVHGVHGYHTGARKAELEARLQSVLEGQSAVIRGLGERPTIPFNADSDFDAEGRLKPGAPSLSPFIRPSRPRS